MKKLLIFLLPILLCLLCGFVAGELQRESLLSWYPSLSKSMLTPPGWVFPLVWTMLYFLMGISAGIIWNQSNKPRKAILTLWGVQLAFNFSWSIWFFALQNIWMGLVIILLLDLLVILYIFRSWQVSRTASLLFWPYLAWLLLATYLNLYICLFN